MLLISGTLISLTVFSQTASAGISGNITIDTTWYGTVYIEGDVIIDPGVTLTIDPGTHVKFNNPAANIYVEGSMLANGESWDWIYFESNQSIPSVSDWESIEGNMTGHMEMTFCDVKHFSSGIGFPDTPGNILNNCTFNVSSGFIGIDNQYMNVSDCTFAREFGVQGSYHVIKDCVFTDASRLTVYGSYCTIDNTFNDGNGIYFTNFGVNNSISNSVVSSGSIMITHNNVRLDNFTYSASGLSIFECDAGASPFPKNIMITNSSFPMDISFFTVDNFHVEIYNTSFNKSKVRYDDTIAELMVGHYADVNVTDSSGQPISGASVWVNNTLNGTVDQFYGVTDANGWLYDVVCTEYRGNDSNGNLNDLDPGEKIYYTPHNFTADKDGSVGNNVTIMNQSKVVNIVLSDTNPPSADSYSPTGLGVATSSEIFVQWNEGMDWTTVENSFNYTDGTTTWDSTTGTWVHNGVAMTSTFTPTMPFDFDTQYWVDVNPTATDAAGNPLDQDKDGTGGEAVQDILNWTFTTASNNIPTITISSPDATSDWTGGTPHAIWWNCTDTEDIATDSLTIFLNYTSTPSSGAIAGPLLNETANPHTWTLPAIDAEDVVVQAIVIDTNGAKGYFDTPAFTIDSTPPQLIDVSPPNNTILAPPHVLVVLTFDESMNQAETEAAFILENSTSAITGTFSWNAQSTEMTFDPTQDLELNTTYWANLTTGAEDNSVPGNAIASFNSTEFKIMESVDNVGPAVTIGPTIEPSVVYVDGVHDTTIWINATIDDFNFGNNNIAAAELMIWNASAPTIPGGSSIPMEAVDGTFDEMNETVTINQTGFTSQPSMTLYYWVHGQDSEGNWGDWELVTLEIIELPDAIPPQILSYSPTGASVSPESSILFSFDEEMNHTSVQEAFSISPATTQGGAFYYIGNYLDYNYTERNQLIQNFTYTITINSSIAKDPAENYLDGNENGIAEGSPTDDVSWSFTTWWDRDFDGIPEDIDPDDDNDGVNDTEDAFPLDPDETVDTDGDGTGDNADTDDDGDGVPDTEDLDPLDPAIGGDTTAPSVPTHLNLTAQDTEIFIKWEASPEPDVHHYSVYRSTDNVTFTRIGNVTGLTSHFDGNVVNDTTYYYKVTAVDNASNESPFSDVKDIIWKVSEQPPPVQNNDYLLYILLIIIIAVILVVVMMLKRKPKASEVSDVVDEELE